MHTGITGEPYSADNLILTDAIAKSDRHRVRLQMSQYTVFARPVVDHDVVPEQSLRGVIRELRVDEPPVLDSVIGHVVATATTRPAAGA